MFILLMLAQLVSQVSGISFAADPQAFLYQTRVSAGNSDCATQAQMMSDRFATATGIQPASTTCSAAVTVPGNTDSVYPITLKYMALQQYFPYSAYLGVADINGAPRSNEGIYSRYADCLSDMEGQVATFEKQTGLTAVSAECQVGTGGISTTYVLRIDGFAADPQGDSKAVNKIFAFKSNLLASDESLPASISNLISSLGGQSVRNVGETYLYYSPAALPLGSDILAVLDSMDDCKAQIGDMAAIFAAAGSKLTVDGCYLVQQSGRVVLGGVHDGGYFLLNDDGYGSREYYSLKECMDDKTGAVAQGKSKDSRVLGGICQPDDYNRSLYVLNLIHTL